MFGISFYILNHERRRRLQHSLYCTLYATKNNDCDKKYMAQKTGKLKTRFKHLFIYIFVPKQQCCKRKIQSK